MFLLIKREVNGQLKHDLWAVKGIDSHFSMSFLPSAIIFVNDTTNESFLNIYEPQRDTIASSAINRLSAQLEVSETISLSEFNARVKADPNYPTVVHLNGLRVLVVLPTFMDTTNRNLADIVLFVKGGIASVEKCKTGKPGQSWDVQRLNIWNLINGSRPSGNCCFPFPGFLAPPQTQTPENPRPPERHRKHFPPGLGVLELYGKEALEENGNDEGVFGDKLRPEFRNDEAEDLFEQEDDDGTRCHGDDDEED